MRRHNRRGWVVTTALLVIALLGLQFWIDVYDAVLVLIGVDRGNAWIAIPVQAIGVALSVVCFRRGRKVAGLFGLFVPLVALIGALLPRRRPAHSSV
jgi:thiamine transporter ThiT